LQAETAEKKKNEEKVEKKSRLQLLKKQDVASGTEHRFEVWHAADGTTSLDANSDDEENLDDLSMIEVCTTPVFSLKLFFYSSAAESEIHLEFSSCPWKTVH
jgi:hypothetical protein